MNEWEMTTADIKSVLKETAVQMQEKHVKEVRDLDAEIGDGDLGITVQKGFKAVEEYLSITDDTEISQILKQVGFVFNEANPSTFSAFFATAIRKAGVKARDRESIGVVDLSAMFEAAVNGIIKLGKAQAGDKTLLDALIPAAEAVREGADKNDTIPQVLSAAAAAAKTGMKSTIDLVSKMGRARSFGERTRGVQDPGATVVYLFLRELSEVVIQIS
jgi:dihydroxyacetone kinase-like protein